MKKAVIGILVLLLILDPLPAQAAAHQQNPDLITIYYTGPQDSIYTALGLVPNLAFIDQVDKAQVMVFNGQIPNPQAASVHLQTGGGVLIFMGSQLQEKDIQALLGFSLSLSTDETPLSLVAAPNVTDPILSNIVWNSAPQVRLRSTLQNYHGRLTPLVTGFEDHVLILGTLQVGKGTGYIFTPHLGDNNQPLSQWAYFNYLIYHLVSQAAGQSPLSYADYPSSPVPHPAERNLLLAFLCCTLLSAVFIFWRVRRYSLAHPEMLDALVSNRAGFENLQATSDWEEVGFHRPLGGFMLALMLGLVLFIPLIIYQNLVLPVYILPSAQALGIWGRVTQFFNFLWLLLDMGTSAAFIKFFAQYRVHDPRKAIQYGQIFVWWQALSGAVQVAVVTLLASGLLPRTIYALYAWSIIIHTLIQLPGFYQVMRHALMAWQRFDYAQILDVGLSLIFPIISQPIIVSLFVFWGSRHPIFGVSTGGLLGLGLAAYAAEALTFLLGLWLYRRLGYNARLLFLAHFDWSTVKASFRYGVFEMLGSVAWAAGQAMEIVITQTRLVNYTEVWGNWGLAQNFIYAFNVLQTLFQNLTASISESISHSHKMLSQYYSAMAYKYGGLISAFIGAVLLAVADRFILGASGPEFSRAATYAIPLIIWGAIQYPSWVGDTVQLGANRPYIKAVLVSMEQIIRVVLAYALLARLQINALIFAYFAGLLMKDIVAYFINHRFCFPQRFYIWQSLAAPLLAGATHYLALRWITSLIWQEDQLTSVLIFLIGILFSYPLFAFLYGLFGGWDDDTLAELHHSATLSSFMRPFSIVFWAATRFGARLSPLHGRFPITIRTAAMAEASTLTRERVEI